MFKKLIIELKNFNDFLIYIINRFLFFKKKRKHISLSSLRELNEIILHSINKTDIADFLQILFVESLSLKPQLIVELGVRGGESTYALERVAKLCNSQIISVDIGDCQKESCYDRWMFIQEDDINFAKNFKSFCAENQIEPKIDILFIDTSHLYEHTVQEIKSWFPYLSNKCKVFFHDINLKKFYTHKDRTIGKGWDNNRGVIKAIENYFGKSFNEKIEFIDFKDNWLIKHYPYSNGFLILERITDLNLK